MRQSYSSFQRTVSLFVIFFFVNMLVSISAYAAKTALPYNADLMLDAEYHDISYKVFEHREGDDAIPIDESSQYRSNALSLKQEMMDVLGELYADASNGLDKVAVGGIFFMYGYPDNLEIIFVSENKVERNYKRTIKLKDKFLRENLRSATITMNIVKHRGDTKENFLVAMEMFSSSDIQKQDVVPKYTLTKVNSWLLITIISVVVITVAVGYYVYVNGERIFRQRAEEITREIETTERVWTED